MEDKVFFFYTLIVTRKKRVANILFQMSWESKFRISNDKRIRKWWQYLHFWSTMYLDIYFRFPVVY